MKKFVFIFLFFLISCPVYGGFSSFTNDFKYYESTKKLWYISVGEVQRNKKINFSIIKNVAIVNLSKSNEVTYIFKDEFNERIQGICFESSFKKELETLEYIGDCEVKNNEGIKFRELKDRICIFTYNPQTKKNSIWFCNKLGLELKKIKSFGKYDDWWIDVKNNKIYIVHQVENKIHFQSIEW